MKYRRFIPQGCKDIGVGKLSLLRKDSIPLRIVKYENLLFCLVLGKAVKTEQRYGKCYISEYQYLADKEKNWIWHIPVFSPNTSVLNCSVQLSPKLQSLLGIIYISIFKTNTQILKTHF